MGVYLNYHTCTTRSIIYLLHNQDFQSQPLEPLAMFLVHY